MRLEAETVIAQVRHKQALLETAQQKLIDTKVIVPIPTDASGKTVSTSKASATVYLVAQRNVSEGETVEEARDMVLDALHELTLYRREAALRARGPKALIEHIAAAF